MKIQRKIKQISYLGEGLLNSYSQVFFSDNPVFAFLILLITFLVPESGIAGLAGAGISILLAKWLGFDKALISKGVFSYNTLLVTLPLGLFFKPGLPLILIVVLASILTFFLTVAFRSRMLKSNLPFLSWPFVISLWIVMLAIQRFSLIEVGDQALFEWNRLYEMGGISLVHGAEWLNNLSIPQSIRTYLYSLGAIFFQYNLLAGIVIAIGLIIYSRIAFLLSVIGFFTAYFFYSIIGLDISSLNYTYIGFNYILTAIAIGGFFLIPSVHTFLWTIVLIPVATLLTVSMEQLLSGSHLSVYALPFNILVPTFLYVLQQRQNLPAGLQPVIIQHNSPEKNLYAWSNYHNRLSRKAGILFRLPFLGKWKVSQGHIGDQTHQSEWRFAWDFVKEGSDGRTFTGNGSTLSDFHCYGMPVYPAADGVVDSIVDGIPDNRPGDTNTAQNWGNSVIVRHAAGLYSKYSHLKPGTFRVKVGDYVLINNELAQTGSSGRSPEPHLHFQFQSEPNINAATIDYPLGYYLLGNTSKLFLRSYDRPVENDWVSNLKVDRLLKEVFHFIPGQKIHVTSNSGPDQSGIESEWQVHTDIYNNSFIEDRSGNATAWFVNDGQLFYFTHYEGSKDNLLFVFFLACYRVPLLFDPQVTVSDQLPVPVSSKSWIRWLQDWIAPFYIFLRTEYLLNFHDSDDPVDPSFYTMSTRINRKVFRKSMNSSEYHTRISKEGSIVIESQGKVLKLSTFLRKLTTLILILLSFSSLASSQQTHTFAEIDSLSYRAYQAAEWKNVVKYAKTGYDAGFDYYYLRMRAGIAELNLKNPVKSAANFRKALNFNENDPIALEYLYSSLLFSGDIAEARLLAASHSPAFSKRMGIPAHRLITSAFVESGYMVNPKADTLGNYHPDAELAHLYYVPSYWYFSAGINLEAGKRFSASVSTNIISYTAIQQFLIQNQTPQTFDVPFDQRGIYLSGNYYLGKGFHLGLASQIISYTLPVYYRVTGEAGANYVLDAFTYRDLALNASMVKSFPYVTLGLAFDANRFKNQWYKQVQTEFTVYPAGNVNTYLKVGGFWLSDSLNPKGRLIAHGSVGKRLSRSVWLEGDYYYGDIRNFTERNGYIVFNNLDVIRKRVGANLFIYSIIPHLDLSLRYQYTLRSASWQIYQNSEYIRDLQKDYPVHSIIGGLTWRF